MINILLANQTIREFLGMEEGQTFMEYTGDMVVSILIVGLGLSLMIIVVWLMQFLSVKLMNKFNNSKDGKAFNDYFDKLNKKQREERNKPQGASHGFSERPGILEVGGASRDSTGFGALEEGLISS